ncbi:MAG: dihydrolipoyl dehydrogenase [Candidatus Puniceispirillum sp.]|nr:dihydrolipoyl dehydrogenase [Candidatus Pelagibacter sp.]MBA4282718.1 dihydrolipoyl dehydrogenase [Candidatus Puniceispirillum sp.]
MSRSLIIIGAGPGGYVAAIRAAQLGMNVTIIEKEHLGGVCLNWGCIPTKALLRSAEVYHLAKNAESFGVKVKDVSFDLDAMVKRSRSVSGQLSGGIKGLLKKNKVTVIEGSALISKPGTVEITLKDGKKETKSADHIIIATGAKARRWFDQKEDHPRIWYAKEAMIPNFMPKKLLIIGSGAIGIEFASFYSTLGAEVTVVEMLPSILPQEDHEISSFAQKQLEKSGVKFKVNAQVKKIDPTDVTVNADIEVDSKIEQESFDAVIVAIGVVGNTENIGLENTKVKVEKSQIVVDDYCQTQEKGIYAIGDVAGAPWLAHKASHEGIICVEAIADLKAHPLKRSNIPGCTYSHPQIASVGLTEKKALELGLKIKVGKFPFQANGKAIALGEPSGMVKTIFDEKTGELLGAHMVGAEVTEMIHGFVLGKSLEATEEDFMNTIYPHPTLSEMMHESVLDAFKRVIHS